MWLFECPHDDQGLVRPLTTAAGVVVLMCDSGGEVWLTPDAVESSPGVRPRPPGWEVTPGVHLLPGSATWSDAAQVPTSWREFYIHPGPE